MRMFPWNYLSGLGVDVAIQGQPVVTLGNDTKPYAFFADPGPILDSLSTRAMTGSTQPTPGVTMFSVGPVGTATPGPGGSALSAIAGRTGGYVLAQRGFGTEAAGVVPVLMLVQTIDMAKATATTGSTGQWAVLLEPNPVTGAPQVVPDKKPLLASLGGPVVVGAVALAALYFMFGRKKGPTHGYAANRRRRSR